MIPEQAINRNRDLIRVLQALTPVLGKISRYGIPLDQQVLYFKSVDWKRQISEHFRALFEIVGDAFNVDSSQQVQDILYRRLRLEPIYERDRPTVNAFALAFLHHKYKEDEKIDNFFYHFRRAKLLRHRLSNFVDKFLVFEHCTNCNGSGFTDKSKKNICLECAKSGLGEPVGYDDHFVSERGSVWYMHPTFLQLAVTGRLNSLEPNVQQFCYSEDTEILTEKGWKLFKDLTYEDRVAQYNIDQTIEFVKPERIIVGNYEGFMRRFIFHKADLLVTPNHRLVSYIFDRKKRKLHFHIDVAEDIPLMSEKIWDRKFIYGGFRKGGRCLAPEDRRRLAIAIAVQADGHLRKDYGAVEFAISRKRKVERLSSLLGKKLKKVEKKRRGRNHAKYQYRINIPLHEISFVFDYIDENKNFKPESILSLCYDDLVFFINEIHLWDGDRTRKSEYKQSSKRDLSVDVVQAATILTGRSSCKTVYSYKGFDYSVVRSHPRCIRYAGRTAHRKEYYRGKVYCVTVPSGMIVVRRNGKALVCGNSRENKKWKIIVRDIVRAPDGYKLVVRDLSKAERLIGAILFNSESVLNEVNLGSKAFTQFAAEAFGVPEEECEKGTDNYTGVKTAAYADQYGVHEETLQKTLMKLDIYMTIDECRDILRFLSEKYSDLKRNIKEFTWKAINRGYVNTYQGRLFRIGKPYELQGYQSWQEIYHRGYNSAIVAFEKCCRIVSSFVIQGTATGDNLQMMLLKTVDALDRFTRPDFWNPYRPLNGDWTKARIVWPKHDEIAVLCREDLVEDVKKITESTMESIEVFEPYLKNPDNGIKFNLKSEVEVYQWWDIKEDDVPEAYKKSVSKTSGFNQCAALSEVI